MTVWSEGIALRRFGVALVLALSACSSAPSEQASFVIVSVDTLSRAKLRAFEPSAQAFPAIDALAARGARLTSAYSTSSWTLPSHGSMMTGLYPDRHGLVDPESRMAAEVRTLASELAGAGYETAGFVSGAFVSRTYGLDRGFSTWVEGEENGEAGSHDGGHAYAARELARADRFLRGRRDSDKPLLLFVHTFLVHDYFIDEFEEDVVARMRACLTNVGACSEGQVAELEQAYDKSLRRFDADFRAFLAELERSANASSTFVLFTTDHGEAFSPEVNRIHHGGRLHADQVNIPMIVTGPGIEAGSEVGDVVSLADVPATILELAGHGQLPDDGASFAGLVRPAKSFFDSWFGADPERPGRAFFMEHVLYWDGGQRRVAKVGRGAPPLQLGVVSGDAHFIRGQQGDELYARAADPSQRNNLAADESRVLAMLRLFEARASWLRKGASAGPAGSQELSEKHKERLRQLGYGDVVGD